MFNYQIAGTTLEASAKVYGLRVDSVYTDVIRMRSNLSRQSELFILPIDEFLT